MHLAAFTTCTILLCYLFAVGHAACGPITGLTFCASMNGRQTYTTIAAAPSLVDSRAIALTRELSAGSTTYKACGFSTGACCSQLTQLACESSVSMLLAEAGVPAASCALEASFQQNYTACLSSMHRVNILALLWSVSYSVIVFPLPISDRPPGAGASIGGADPT
jgi:hypothetical protein